MNEGVDLQAVVVAVKRILVPIDRSGYREKITAYGISLGKAWGAEITAIHVIEPVHALPDGGAEAKGQAREEETRRQAEDLLNKIDILARIEGVNIKKEALEESDIVGKAIIDYAKKNNVDVIVIGTRGMTAVQEYFLEVLPTKSFTMHIVQYLQSIDTLGINKTQCY
jgi:nucleotide-binding universal stress UspA family protein